jgi:hypothetical protein
MRNFMVIAALALVVPSLAFAQGKPPTHPSQGSKAAPKVMYVLKGTLTAYTPANGATNGTVTIAVKSANYHGRSFLNKTLTFEVTSKTTFTGTFAANDNGVVKFRWLKSAAPGDTTQVPAVHVIDQGAVT